MATIIHPGRYSQCVRPSLPLPCHRRLRAAQPRGRPGAPPARRSRAVGPHVHRQRRPVQRVPVPRHLADLRQAGACRAASTTRTPAASTLGNWNSNVNEGAGFPAGNLEMDFYGGWKKTWGDWGLDLGAIYYYYPGTNAELAGDPFSPRNNRTGKIAHRQRAQHRALHRRQLEVPLAEVLPRRSATTSRAPNTKGSSYLDLTANYDLGDGWGINGHVGAPELVKQHDQRPTTPTGSSA